VVDLNKAEGKDEALLELAEGYERLANALYIADEKNMAEEKDKLFAAFTDRPMEEVRRRAYAVILAIGKRFDMDNSRFSDAFGQQYNYLDKIGRIEDGKLIFLKHSLASWKKWKEKSGRYYQNEKKNNCFYFNVRNDSIFIDRMWKRGRKYKYK